jgi:hypothetical protein
MTAPRPPSPLDRAFFALVTRGWNAHKIASYESTLRKRDIAIVFTITVFVMLPFLYFWTEKAA